MYSYLKDVGAKVVEEALFRDEGFPFSSWHTLFPNVGIWVLESIPALPVHTGRG